MNKPTDSQQQTQKAPRSKKKIVLIGVVFVACALLLKRDAH